MSEPPKDTPDDRALDEMTGALREAGGADAQSLPPDVRRATLEALWVADAARYERSSRRSARLRRAGTAALAAALLLGLCGLLARLVYIEWRQRQQIDAHLRAAATQPVPPPAAAPATQRPGPAAAPGSPAPSGGPSTAAAPPTAAAGTVGGRVVFLGTPPSPQPIRTGMAECHYGHPPLLDESVVVGEAGGLANVVVSVSADGGVPLPPSATRPTKPAVLDQKGCRYVPHVLAVQVGQPVVVKNSDPFLHNVHSLAIDNPAFNFGQPNIDPGRKVDPMKVAERFKIKCDVHPWMAAHVSVFEHPYFAVTGDDGAFVIPGNLPDGAYTLTAWHETLGEKRAHVVVADGKAPAADFVFDAAGLGR